VQKIIPLNICDAVQNYYFRANLEGGFVRFFDSGKANCTYFSNIEKITGHYAM